VIAQFRLSDASGVFQRKKSESVQSRRVNLYAGISAGRVRSAGKKEYFRACPNQFAVYGLHSTDAKFQQQTLCRQATHMGDAVIQASNSPIESGFHGRFLTHDLRRVPGGPIDAACEPRWMRFQIKCVIVSNLIRESSLVRFVANGEIKLPHA